MFLMFFIFRNVWVAIVNDALQQKLAEARRSQRYDTSKVSSRVTRGANADARVAVVILGRCGGRYSRARTASTAGGRPSG